MKNCVIVTKEELELLLLLVDSNGLESLAVVPEDYDPSPEVIAQIKTKGFLETGEKGASLHEFVQFVLWTATRATASFRMIGQENACCDFYLYKDIIIFLRKTKDSQYYIFQWIPFITTAIGGLSEYFSFIPEDCRSDESGIVEEWEEGDYPSFQAAVWEHLTWAGKKPEVLFFQGRMEQNISLMAALVPLEDRSILYQAKDGKLTYRAVTHTEWIQAMSEWLIPNHGNCMKTMEES